MQQKTLASTSLSPYLGKWSLRRYMLYINKSFFLLLCSCVQSFTFSYLTVPAGVVQISGSPRVSSGYAHHHLRCDQTRSWNPQSQFAGVSWRAEMELNHHFTWRLLCSFILCHQSLKLWFWWPIFCTKDEGDWCEYTTWSCTVTVQSLGTDVKWLLLTLLWHESVSMPWYVCFFMWKYNWSLNCFAFFVHFRSY